MMKQEGILTMSNQKATTASTVELKSKITKTSYEKIVNNINRTWPQWKKNLCNQELIISVKSKKI